MYGNSSLPVQRINSDRISRFHRSSASTLSSSFIPSAAKNQSAMVNSWSSLAYDPALTLSTLDGPYGPQANTVNYILPGGKVQNVVTLKVANVRAKLCGESIHFLTNKAIFRTKMPMAYLPIYRLSNLPTR